MRNRIQTENPEVDREIYSWLFGTPPSDRNFQDQLKNANAATIQAVLQKIPAENNRTRRKVLESRLRRLGKTPSGSEKNLTPEKKSTTDDIFSEDKIFSIQLENIVPSPFEPQMRRRAKFINSETEELGNSIVKQGLFSPIVVRPSREFRASNNLPVYEIVFGERRFLAHRVKNLPTIKCFVRELSDAEVIELQYEENHRRQENDPLDDAFYFQYLKEKEGYTDEDLADRLGTTLRDVREKLKLNDLIEDARIELSGGRLPLRHAYYLAKFPSDTQNEIVREQYAYRHYDRDEKAVSFEIFRDEVEDNILRRLIDSPFDDLIKNLIVEFLFEGGSGNRGRGDDILRLVKDWKNAPKNFGDRDRLREFADALDKRGQSQILFLLSAAGADDVEAAKIIRDYTPLNFFTLDAEARFEFAPTEFKQQAAESGSGKERREMRSAAFPA